MEPRGDLVTLNRPERKNPLTFESYAELRDLFRAWCGPDVKVVVLTGAGGNFCSGGDVHEIIGPLTQAWTCPACSTFTRMTGDLIKAMRACPQPVIAAIDGICAGAGAMLALAFRPAPTARAKSKTAFLFSRVGLAGCDMGACAMLPRMIGQGRASELLFTGRAHGRRRGRALGLLQPPVRAGRSSGEALAGAGSPPGRPSPTA
jgi:enoyl-CoA hydratase/carnithine racemase